MITGGALTKKSVLTMHSGMGPVKVTSDAHVFGAGVLVRGMYQLEIQFSHKIKAPAATTAVSSRSSTPVLGAHNKNSPYANDSTSSNSNVATANGTADTKSPQRPAGPEFVREIIDTYVISVNVVKAGTSQLSRRSSQKA